MDSNETQLAVRPSIRAPPYVMVSAATNHLPEPAPRLTDAPPPTAPRQKSLSKVDYGRIAEMLRRRKDEREMGQVARPEAKSLARDLGRTATLPAKNRDDFVRALMRVKHKAETKAEDEAATTQVEADTVALTTKESTERVVTEEDTRAVPEFCLFVSNRRRIPYRTSSGRTKHPLRLPHISTE